MSDRTNVRRATDHWVTVWSGYCLIGLCSVGLLPVGLLSLGLMSGWAAFRRATVLSVYCLLGMCPRESVRREPIECGLHTKIVSH